jgi:ribosomal protein L24
MLQDWDAYRHSKLSAPSFTIFVKRVNSSTKRNTTQSKERQLGISHRERRIEVKKTRTLEQHKGAARKVPYRSMGGAPGSVFATRESTLEIHVCVTCVTEIALWTD